MRAQKAAMKISISLGLCLVCLQMVESFSSVPSKLYDHRCSTIIKRGVAENTVRFARAKASKIVPKMSDMSDMTIEMLKRLERTVDQLSETDLIRVSFGSF